MGKIYLNDMNFYAHHGCYEEERLIGTNFKVDLEIEYDSQKAENSDDINDAVNYLELYKIVKEEIMIESHILENISRRILNHIFKNFSEITYSKVKVTKMAPPLGGDIKTVSFELEQKR